MNNCTSQIFKKIFLIALFLFCGAGSMKAQLISQYTTSKATGGGAVDLFAIELFNGTAVEVNYGIGDIVIQEDGSSVWSNLSALSLGPREVVVITSNSDLINYCSNVIQSQVLTDGFTGGGFAFEQDHVISVSIDGGSSIYDQLGNPAGSNKGSAGINNNNYERELEFLFTPFPNGCWDAKGNNAASATPWTQVYSQKSPMAHASGSYDVNDFEGFGLAPGNIQYDGTNWFTPANVAGSTTSPPTTNNCVIEMNENSAGVIDDQHNVKDLVVTSGSTVTLGANSSGYAQAKKVVRSLGSGTVKSQKYLSNDGWHMIGTPFPNGFANSEGRGANALYWYWNGRGWTEASGSTVPPGLGLMVRVGSAYPYSYTGGGAGIVTTGNGGSSDPYLSFTWDRTGSADGTLFYAQDSTNTSVQESGWNIISNPFTCALDWQAVWDNGDYTNLNSTIYISDPGIGWIEYNAQSSTGTFESGLVPPNGAFMVQITSDAAASLSVNVNDHSSLSVPSDSYNKNKSYASDVLHVGITDVSTSATSFMWVCHDELGTASYDAGIDSWGFFTSGDNIPDIYMPEGSDKIIQNLTDLTFSQSFPIATADLTPGNTYSIGVEQIVKGNNYHVTLEDTYLNSMIDLSLQPYTFAELYESVDDRFILHINQNTVGVDEVVNHEFYSYTQENELFLNAGSLDIKRVKVFTMDGKMIGNVSYKENSKIIELPTHGIYVIEIQANQGTFTDKIIY